MSPAPALAIRYILHTFLIYEIIYLFSNLFSKIFCYQAQQHNDDISRSVAAVIVTEEKHLNASL